MPGCGYSDKVHIINATDRPLHVQLATTFRVYGLRVDRHRCEFDFVVYAGQRWSSQTAARRQRAEDLLTTAVGPLVFRARGLLPPEPWSAWMVRCPNARVPVTITVSADELGALHANASAPDGYSAEIEPTDVSWFR